MQEYKSMNTSTKNIQTLSISNSTLLPSAISSKSLPNNTNNSKCKNNQNNHITKFFKASKKSTNRNRNNRI